MASRISGPVVWLMVIQRPVRSGIPGMCGTSPAGSLVNSRPSTSSMSKPLPS
jgi:hypothetical protein